MSFNFYTKNICIKVSHICRRAFIAFMQNTKVCHIRRWNRKTDSVKQRRTEGSPMKTWIRKAYMVIPFLLCIV